MKTIAAMLLLTVLSRALGVAGEISGNITENGKPAAGVKVEITSSAAKPYSTESDKFGSYRVFVKETGNCKLTVKQSSPVDIASYAKPVRYNLVLEKRNEKYFITIK